MAPGSRRGRRGISFRVREEMVKGLVRLYAAGILVEKVHHRDPILLREGARMDVFSRWLMGFRVYGFDSRTAAEVLPGFQGW